MQKQYQVIVVGGGITGAATACALARGGINVALLERIRPVRTWQDESVDIRVSAMTKASQNILEMIGVWPEIIQRGACPYREMRVWDSAADGELHFDCSATGLEELGHIVENRVTVAALWDLLENLPSTTLICPAKIIGMSIENKGAHLVLEDGRHLNAELIIAADGHASALRSMANIDVTGWDYKQEGLVAAVTTSLDHDNTARQRFLDQGPLAFLPLKNGQSSIVWTLETEMARQYLALSDDEFLACLQQASAGILGDMLAVGPRASFPLRFQYANRYVDERLALIGDAAHTMHPLAGQGANAGLLDAAAIAELILKAKTLGRPIASRRVLRQYERWRKGDNLLMMTAMDAIKRIYAINLQPVVQLRSSGMNVINRADFLKERFNRHALGFRSDLPKLAKGLSCWST